MCAHDENAMRSKVIELEAELEIARVIGPVMQYVEDCLFVCMCT